MRSPALLAAVLLVAALPCAARPGAAEPISKAEVDARIDEIFARFRQVKSGEVKKEDFVRYVKDQAEAAAAPRRQALDVFAYAFVLEHSMNDDAGARRQYRRALDLHPAFPAAHIQLGQLALEADDTKEAWRMAKAALEVDPRYADAFVLQAMLYQRKDNHERAIELLKKSIDLDGTPGAFRGLAASYVVLARTSVSADERKDYARRAVLASNALVTLKPGEVSSYLFKSQVLQDVGRIRSAVDFLEESYATTGLDEEQRLPLLLQLRKLYGATGNVEGATETLKRLLANAHTPQAARDQIQGRLADLEAKGRSAFIIWQIEDIIEVLENKGLSVDQRVEAMRALFEIWRQEEFLAPEFAQMRWEIFRRCFRVIVEAPPELIVPWVRFVRESLPDPRLARIVVHFIYPSGETEELREEAVRTLASIADRAAIPALYHCLLHDDSGRVLREVDKQLATLGEARSPLGGGIQPLTREEAKQARIFWSRWARSPEGGRMLAAAFGKLAEVITPDPTHTRQLRTAPMVDHAATILQDNDVAWPAWKAAYEFLVEYWGKDFRPVERRNQPVEEFERGHVVKELAAYLSTPDEAEAAPVAPGAKEEPAGKPEGQ